jgi:hypothetical protein
MADNKNNGASKTALLIAALAIGVYAITILLKS